MRIRMCSTRGRLFCIALVMGLSTLALALPSAGRAVLNLEDVTQEQLPDFDARDSVAPTTAQLDAANALGASVGWNRFGVASSVIKRGGYVATGLQGDDAASAARSWLDSNKALFRLDSTDALVADAARPLVGTSDDYAVVFRQQADGVASTDGFVTASVVGSKEMGWNIAYISSSLTGGSTAATGADNLGPAVAWTQAANDAGLDVSIVDVSVQSTQAGATTLAVNGLADPQHVKKAVFATPHRGSREAYDATVTAKDADGTLTSYQVVVDAETGAMLYRQNLVNNLTDNPTWLVNTIAPHTTPINRFPWNYPSADARELWCWTSIAACKFVAGDTGVIYPLGVASKHPWDVDQNPTTGAPLATTQTTGNNVDNIQRWVAVGARQWSVGYHATSPTRGYKYPFTDVWFTTKCDPANLTGTGNDIDAAITNLFAMHNRMHDFAYYLGFDEPHWNSQQWNNGLGGLQNDGLFGNAQAAGISGGAPNYAGRDNANMGTGADGTHAQTNMFLWQSLPGAFYAPCVDGDFDMTVIGHEFGHMIENRLIGKGVGARQGTHAGAMGEAFGDFDALEYLSEFHYAPVPGSKPWTEGAYVTGNHYNAIRDFLASEPMGGDFPEPGKNPKTVPINLGDYGFDLTGPEVHADGEIWVAVQYDIRDLLLGRYPAGSQQLDIDCARGRVSVDRCPGNRRWIQLYYDAMILMPRNATILQARDAMLAADVARFAGTNQDLIWQGYAQRGFGQFASVTSNGDTNPVPDFSSALANNATLVFSADSADGNALPMNANIYVGDYEARATPIADTNPATTGPNLDNTAQFVPNGSARTDTYNFVANAPGYGHVRFMVKNLAPGETRNITIHFPTNYASMSQGASASGEGADFTGLIDDTEGTNWDSTGAPVQGRQVVVQLGGGGPVTFKRVNVSALLVPTTPTQNRFTALRSFELYGCTAGSNPANPTCDGTNAAGWTRILKSQGDSFPSVNPRPVAPDLTLRSWNVPTTAATHVKLVVVDNQCTGQDSYHGDQDNDPNNNSDCRVGQPPFVPRTTEVHASELQILSAQPTVDGKGVRTG
jgi:extracellular elastinolytic metalloproteinase